MSNIRLLAAALSLPLLGAGCASSQPFSTTTIESPATVVEADESDFTPSTGASTGPGEFGPWVNRIVLATSTDGQSFTSTGEVIGDQFDVPDLAILPDGRVALYAIAWTAGARNNQLVVALSEDNGTTWTYHYVTITGTDSLERGPSPADPDVVVRDDGTVRMYFTYAAKTHYADSTDGVTFAYGGEAFDGNGAPVLDPSVVAIDGMWHLYAGGPGDNWHATSTDGAAFTAEWKIAVTGTDGLRYMLSNALTVDDGVRFWGFSNQGDDIHSFESTDGSSFTGEGVSLAFDAANSSDASYVKDASVIKLEDGRYLMAYVTHIPE